MRSQEQSAISEERIRELIAQAFSARERAYAPYSGFRVGAALEGKSGRIYPGCNIENAAYTPTNCAERTAVFKAVYEGERSFDAIAIVCSGNSPAFPCGVCRQVLSEFCGPEMPVLCANAHRESVLCTLGELLPHSFGREDLEK